MDPEGLDPDCVLDCASVAGNSLQRVLHWTGTFLREVIDGRILLQPFGEFLKLINRAY